MPLHDGWPSHVVAVCNFSIAVANCDVTNPPSAAATIMATAPSAMPRAYFLSWRAVNTANAITVAATTSAIGTLYDSGHASTATNGLSKKTAF